MKRFSLLSIPSFILYGVILAFTGIVVNHMVTTQPEDIEEYNQLLNTCQPDRSKEKNISCPSKQQRTKLRRDIIVSTTKQPLHFCLKSKTSYITLEHLHSHEEIIEYLQDVSCYMQEELYYLLPSGQEALMQSNGMLLLRGGSAEDLTAWISPKLSGIKLKQIVRHITSKDARYYYQSQYLVANNAFVTQFSIPGHTLEEAVLGYEKIENADRQIILKAKAGTAEISFNDNQPRFSAKNLKATLFADVL